MIDFEKFENPDEFDPEDVSPEEADFLQENYPELYDQTGYARMDVLVDKFKEYVNSLGIVGAQCSVNEAVADKMAGTVIKVEDLAKKSGAIPHLKVEWDKPYSGAAQISCLFEYLEVETAQFFESVKDASEIYFDSINDESFMMTLVFRNAYNYEIYHLNNP